MKKIQSVAEVTKLVQDGKTLSLAGDERALSQLPKGNWVAGTTPYFMGKTKGEFRQDAIYVDVIEDHVMNFKIASYDADSIPTVGNDRYKNGYTILVIPAFSQIHSDYALSAMNYEGLFDTPMLGWISGIDLNSSDTPKIFNGLTGESSSDHAVALHVELPAAKMAQLEIINIHHMDQSSPVIEFLENSFSAVDCLVDGEEWTFGEYISRNNIDTKSPMVCDYSGATINVSIKEVNADSGQVDFYAPVFTGRKYRLALPLEDYAKEFAEHLPGDRGNKDNQAFSCNCILNFLYGDLEGRLAGYPGPITFGEIGYHLLNQTMTYLDIVDIDQAFRKET